VFETIQEGVNEGFFLEQVVPFRVVEIGCNNCGRFAVTFTHQLEKAVDLFGPEGEIPEFVDQQDGVVAEPLDELGGGSGLMKIMLEKR